MNCGFSLLTSFDEAGRRGCMRLSEGEETTSNRISENASVEVSTTIHGPPRRKFMATRPCGASNVEVVAVKSIPSSTGLLKRVADASSVSLSDVDAGDGTDILGLWRLESPRC